MYSPAGHSNILRFVERVPILSSSEYSTESGRPTITGGGRGAGGGTKSSPDLGGDSSTLSPSAPSGDHLHHPRPHTVLVLPIGDRSDSRRYIILVPAGAKKLKHSLPSPEELSRLPSPLPLDDSLTAKTIIVSLMQK